MKIAFIKFLCVSFVIMLCICQTVCFADSAIITNGNMESSAATFVRATGDANRDGFIDANDLVCITNYLLGKTSDSSYLDANEKGGVNLIDLIVMKKLCSQPTPIRVNEGKGPSKGLVIDATNPKIAYKNAIVSSMKTNTTYQFTYDCKTNSNVKITLKGAKTADIVSNSGVCASFTTKTFLFTTGNSLTSDSGNELIITGNGVLDNISIQEVTRYWSDGSAKEQGGKDIYAQ